MEYWPAIVVAGLVAAGLLLLFDALARALAGKVRGREASLALPALDAELRQLTRLSNTPSVSHTVFEKRIEFDGQYGGRSLTLSDVLDWFPYDAPQSPMTTLTVRVSNTARYRLNIRESLPLDKWLRPRRVLTGSDEIDRRFHLGGRPPEFVQQAIRLILETGVAWGDCAISLEGPRLTCCWPRALKDTKVRMADVNLLCDLARLAELMGSASPAAS